MADHSPLIEQLDTWADKLEAKFGAEVEGIVGAVIAEMKQTAADLRADVDDEEDD